MKFAMKLNWGGEDKMTISYTKRINLNRPYSAVLAVIFLLFDRITLF